MRRTFNLIIVVVQTDNFGSGELCDLPGWPSNSTPNIENAHSLSHLHHVGQVVFVPCNSLIEALSIGETAEVEARSPAVFVDIGCKVVVMTSKGCIFCPASLGQRQQARKRTQSPLH